MKHVVLAAMFAVGLSSNALLAAEPDRLGQAMPRPPGAATSPVQAKLDSFNLDSVGIDGVSGSTVLKFLSKQYGDRQTIASRGRHDAEVYKAISPSVVIVVTDKAIGSGSYIGNDQILTNWHVVQGFQKVGLYFKPSTEGAKPGERDFQVAEVVHYDPQLDLALLKATKVPAELRPVALGSESDIQVGADVHAIGHPTGEAWSYTKGIISQYRRDYEWKTENSTHKANVIQTQTPINPGNSGGPLLSDDEKLVGVNSFQRTGGQNMNFAVSVVDVQRFLDDSKSARSVRTKTVCEPKQLYAGRDQDNVSDIVLIDRNCDGKVDLTFVKPDDTRRPILALIDSNNDGKTDIRVEDRDRDGKWDISFHDTDFDGRIDLVGHHPDGKLVASRFEKYAIASR